MPDNKLSLSSEDIKLLMGNYQNIIQMSTILLEQQKQLLSIQNQVLQKQEILTSDQNVTHTQLGGVNEKLEGCIKNIQSTHDTIQTSCVNIDKSISDKLTDTKQQVQELKIDTVKQHASINKNVYIAWVGTGTIILALVGLLISIFDKYNTIDKIFEIVNQLSHYFSLS